MIPRRQHLHKLKSLLKSYPIVGMIGPRQIGKTTLARQLAKQHKGPTTHFDLEDPRDLARLTDPALETTCRLEDDLLHIDVSARSLSRLVELSFDGADIVFSDNYFDVPAGRTVVVTCPLPMGWSASQAGAALRIRSVYDSFVDRVI